MEGNGRTNDEIEFLWDGYDYIVLQGEVSATVKKKEDAGTAC